MRWTRVDRAPLWGDRLERAGPWRYLLAPFLIYELLCYTWRQDVTEQKARPWIWRDKLQSRRRYVQALLCYLGPPSHLFWNILPMSFWVVAVTLGVVFFERYTGIALDPGNVTYRAFRNVSFVVSLLLSTRINRGFTRWWNARNGFRGAGSAIVALCHQCPVWGVDPAIQACMVKWGTCWHFSLKAELFGEKRLDPRAEALLDEEELRDYYGYKKGRHLCGNMLRRLIQEAVEAHTGGMRQEMFSELQSTLMRGYDSMSACNRISQQALPEALTMLSSGFLSMWLLIMPLGLWEDSIGRWGATSIVVMILVAILLLSCDELATQLENPWKLLPIEVTLQRTLKAAGSSLEDASYVDSVRERERQKMAARAAELKTLGSSCRGLSAQLLVADGDA